MSWEPLDPREGMLQLRTVPAKKHSGLFRLKGGKELESWRRGGGGGDKAEEETHCKAMVIKVFRTHLALFEEEQWVPKSENP